MPLDILITTNRIESDPAARRYIDFARESQDGLGLGDALLYYDFPTYADYETISHKPDILLLSPKHGVLAIHFVSAEPEVDVESIDASLLQFCSILIGRLLKSKSLRRTIGTLKFAVSPVLVFSDGYAGHTQAETESMAVESTESFSSLLDELSSEAVSSTELAEARSVIEGAKALARPKPRSVGDPQVNRLAAALLYLESDIANFDDRQRRAALINVQGPHRIRGLAGSGKTVILAMKAAHLHLTDPEARILITFYTRSLQSTLKHLITRFFRNYRDEDPDWEKVHIRHGWGGTSRAGVYSDACRRHGVAALTFPGAKQGADAFAQQDPRADRMEPFEFACADLLRRVPITPFYDHVLIDEGQDFPSSFYQLCYHSVKGDRDRKNIVWAYDELQNILNVKIRSPEQLFGTDSDSEARVSLQRAARFLAPGSDNDTVLEKCYRNQREVLVSAHALGFGIYGTIVQLLESPEHWEDVGYRLETAGPFEVGKHIKILRPVDNSPVSLNLIDNVPVIDYIAARDFEAEIEWVTEQAAFFMSEGLQPEDIIVVGLDDRNAKTYFRHLSKKFAESGVATNNIIADPYTEPPFSIPGRITLSTVYRAKGNEAAVVFAVGVDAVSLRSRLARNKLFTAFTRTKAWLRISGIKPNADAVTGELRAALQHFPFLEFDMPDLARIETIQRDLNQRTLRVKRIRKDYLRRLKQEGLDEQAAAELLGLGAQDEAG